MECRFECEAGRVQPETEPFAFREACHSSVEICRESGRQAAAGDEPVGPEVGKERKDLLYIRRLEQRSFRDEPILGAARRLPYGQADARRTDDWDCAIWDAGIGQQLLNETTGRAADRHDREG